MEELRIGPSRIPLPDYAQCATRSTAEIREPVVDNLGEPHSGCKIRRIHTERAQFRYAVQRLDRSASASCQREPSSDENPCCYFGRPGGPWRSLQVLPKRSAET